MASPALPLATLGPTIGPTGIAAPAFNDILNSLIASFQAIYGSDALLTPDTQDYQLLAIFAKAISDANSAAIAIYNSFSPQGAQGVGLSSLVKINGLQRELGTNSMVVVTITGTVGTIIQSGVAQDQAGNLWNLPSTVTIPGSGSIQVTAVAQVEGAIAAPAGTVTGIFTPTLGWQSVTNANPAVPGNPVETDAALRQRQQQSTDLPAQSPLSALAAAIANLPGVIRSTVYENQTAATDGNSVPGHAIVVIVEGGTLQQIAQTIELKKTPGALTFAPSVGGVTISVTDPAGLIIPIGFCVLQLTTIWVSLTVKQGPGYLSTTTQAIQNALLNFINALGIGQTVFYNWLVGVADLGGALGLSYHISALTVGTAPSPAGTSDVSINFNAAATTVAVNIVITLT